MPVGPLQEFCVRNHITKLAFFGSVVHDDFGPESDIDLHVYFEVTHVPSLFKLVELEEELAALLQRKVDLRTPEDLGRYFREEVIGPQLSRMPR